MFERMLLIFVTIIGVAVSISPTWARHRPAYRYCDPQTGDAIRPDIQALNRLKNREVAPTAKDIDVKSRPIMTPPRTESNVLLSLRNH
jgi:hypothetical protein